MAGIVAILGLVLFGSGVPAVVDNGETLCNRDTLPDGATVTAQGTLWSDSQHGAYLRDSECSDIAIRLGIHPEGSDPSVAELLADLARSAWPHGVIYNVDVRGRIIHTQDGLRIILSDVVDYEKAGP